MIIKLITNKVSKLHVMKKIFLVLISILVIKTTIAQRAHLGFKAGLNMSNLVYENTGQSDYKLGFHAGLLSHIHVNRKFAIQPEIVYSQQGRVQHIANNKYKVNLNYINIPVLAQYMFGKGYRLEAGPQLGLLVNGKVRYLDTETTVSDNYKPADLGLAIGFGYLSHSKIGIDLRWVFGLSNINDAPGANAIRTRNNVGQFGIFYQFDHRGKK